ncbi:hypothetical protein BC332_26553 [Capsicum chinense]|nr:hypothetical protein BC332_26553 [Capsicum chinense]
MKLPVSPDKETERANAVYFQISTTSAIILKMEGKLSLDLDWAENRSKHRNDPITMKKLTDKATSKSKKSTSKASKKKFDDSGRPRLPKGMKYRIDKVPPHPLHMGNLYNCAFGEEIKEYFGENDNKDELHVWVQGEILKFTMLEFAIISGLKCTGAITHSKLITRVQNGNFDNAEDALNLHSYKNIQPTTDEVRRLDLSFSKDFKICDPTTYASTSDSGKLKRTSIDIQQRVGTIAEEFGDFSTISPR